MYILKIVIAGVVYPIIYLGLHIVMHLLPNLFLFRQSPILFTKGYVQLAAIDLVFFGFGLIVFMHSQYMLDRITRENRRVRPNREKVPQALVTTGVYATVRHPMYGAFVVLYISVFFATRSVYGVLLPLLLFLVQLVNVSYEEKHVLIPLFGEAYTTYMQAVPKRLFTKMSTIYILIAILLTIAGILANIF